MNLFEFGNIAQSHKSASTSQILQMAELKKKIAALESKSSKEKKITIPKQKGVLTVNQTAMLIDLLRKEGVITLKDNAPVAKVFESLTGHSGESIRKALSNLDTAYEKGNKVSNDGGNKLILKQVFESLLKRL